MKVFLIIVGIVLCVTSLVVYFKKGVKNFIIGTILFWGGIAVIGNGLASDSNEYRPSHNEYYNDSDDESNVSFKGSQTGYTGECSICDCPAYDRSSDGICECGHYKTDHKWHN